MSYMAPCPCGGFVRVESRADLQICRECDYANRRVVLYLAMLVNAFDLRTSELLVRMTSFETELDQTRGTEARRRRCSEVGGAR